MAEIDYINLYIGTTWYHVKTFWAPRRRSHNFLCAIKRKRKRKRKMSNDTNGIQFMPGVHRNAQVQIMEALAQAMQASGVATVGELVGATNATTSPPDTEVD